MSTYVGVRSHASKYLAVLVSALLSVATLSTVAHAVGDPVKVCHATGSGKFVTQNPDRDSVVQPSGHAAHADDIIPPFTYTEQVGKGKDAVFVTKEFLGQNWGPDGQATWNNGCVVPSPPAPHDECPALAGDQPAGTQCTQPDDVVAVAVSEGPADCEALTVPVTTTTTTTTYSFDSVSNTWKGATSTSKKTTGRPATDAECPPVVPPTHDECAELAGDQPVGFECTKADVVVVGAPVEGAADCVSGLVPVTTTTSTTTYSFDVETQKWVGATTTVDAVENRKATDAECPPVVPPTHDECAELAGDQPEGFDCEGPAPKITTSTSEGEADCEAGTVRVTRTSVTTPYVFDQWTNTWIPGAPESSTKHVTRSAKPSECPDEPVGGGAGGDGTGKDDAKPVTDTDESTPAVAGEEDETGQVAASSGLNRPAAVVLPKTGAATDLGVLAGTALALMMAGGLTLSTQRRVLRLRQ